jgi:isopentenyl phosphate kinase
MSDQTGIRVRCILKLGGAAITKKNQFETLDEEVLGTTVRHIVDTLQTRSNGTEADCIVIVHGAGERKEILYEAAKAAAQSLRALQWLLRVCIQHRQPHLRSSGECIKAL